MENLIYAVEILGLLFGILLSCLTFANAIEHLGEHLKLGDQVTGSILAAVGTALPETLIPLVAIVIAAQGGSMAINGTTAAHEIAVGAIVGAPFMLSTLAFFLMGLTVFLHRKTRKTKTTLKINVDHLKRDLYYFLVAFALLIGASFLGPMMKVFVVVCLALLYAFYVLQTIRAAKKHREVEDVDLPELYAKKFFKLPENFTSIIGQTVISLLAIIFFAKFFVHTIETVAFVWGVSPLVLSLIITPIATELPEKVNSCIWSSQNKDTLAMGNITGAMVFQSTIPGTIGILFTPWHFDSLTYTCAFLALTSVVALLYPVIFHKKIKANAMMLAGILYVVYLYLAFFKHF